jgi:hypothetical protein
MYSFLQTQKFFFATILTHQKNFSCKILEQTIKTLLKFKRFKNVSLTIAITTCVVTKTITENKTNYAKIKNGHDRGRTRRLYRRRAPDGRCY